MRNMASYLAEHFGYRREDMVILTDDQQRLKSQPTKQNILHAMHWLVKDADSLFFHYSGMITGHHVALQGLINLGQDTATKSKIWTVTKLMDMMRSFTLLISDKTGASPTMRCTASWCGHYKAASA